jgi:hypothetical protein
MSRRTRKQLVGKKDENRQGRDSERNLEALAVLLWRDWHWLRPKAGNRQAAPLPHLSLSAELLDEDQAGVPAWQLPSANRLNTCCSVFARCKRQDWDAKATR